METSTLLRTTRGAPAQVCFTRGGAPPAGDPGRRESALLKRRNSFTNSCFNKKN